MSNPAIREYVRTAADTAEVVGSVCTGALVLASVGLLQGRQATTHWSFVKVLERKVLFGLLDFGAPVITAGPKRLTRLAGWVKG